MSRLLSGGFLPYVGPYVLFLVLVELEAPLIARVAAPFTLLAFHAWRGDYPELSGFRPSWLDAGFGLGLAILWLAPYVFVRSLPWPEPGPPFDPGQWGPERAPLLLAVRLAGFALVTPFVEELFVRSFLLRWIDVFDRSGDFRAVPIGHFAWRSFVLTSLYFMGSHVPWEWWVALPTGVLFNLWLYYRRHLGATILAHAVTNACLWVAVVFGGDAVRALSEHRLDPWIFL
jgi:CAAX prenyl protease-like protein